MATFFRVWKLKPSLLDSRDAVTEVITRLGLVRALNEKGKSKLEHLDEEAVKESLLHGLTPGEAAAFAEEYAGSAESEIQREVCKVMGDLLDVNEWMLTLLRDEWGKWKASGDELDVVFDDAVAGDAYAKAVVRCKEINLALDKLSQQLAKPATQPANSPATQPHGIEPR